MNHFLHRIPLPLSGVALGVAALGNLLQNYSDIIPPFCGALAAVLLSFVFLKYLCFPAEFQKDMNDPVLAGVAGTFTMALMILSTYLEPYSSAALGMWLAAILLHSALMVYYTLRFVRYAGLRDVLANYFIVYVGIAAAAVTAPVFGSQEIAAATFWIGFAAFLIVIIPITMRYARLPDVPDPVKPLICIYAAPASLCLTAYIETIMPVSPEFLIGLYIAACLFYLFALYKVISYRNLPFYPSYAAFTFPFVIAATASTQVTSYLETFTGCALPLMEGIALMQTGVSVVLVGYVLLRYLQFFLKRTPVGNK
ncbi:MAG: TDT family transporter [Methanocorpusculum sp.]|nr:TDT family transporter [Methanocorpusculum sp.]MDE2521806.1 TDT family transporter [Methanocorpusculum sp.]MDE2524090.1 TDT family transporter [Methanocorpusculum sp.]